MAAGFVGSLNRPGGNATGLTVLNNELQPKRLGLLREMIPNQPKFALLVNPNNPTTVQADIPSTTSAARRLGLDLLVVNGGSESEIGAQASLYRGRLAGHAEIAGQRVLDMGAAEESANALRKALRALMQHAVAIKTWADDPTRSERARDRSRCRASGLQCHGHRGLRAAWGDGQFLWLSVR